MALSSPKCPAPFIPPSLSSSSLDEPNWKASAAITDFYRSPNHTTTAAHNSGVFRGDSHRNPAPRPPLAKAVTPGSRNAQSCNGRSRSLFQVRTPDAERSCAREWDAADSAKSPEDGRGSGAEAGLEGSARRSSAGREIGRSGSAVMERTSGGEFSFSTSASFREGVSSTTDGVTVTSPTPQPESRRSRTLPCRESRHSAPMAPRDDIFDRANDSGDDSGDACDSASDSGGDGLVVMHDEDSLATISHNLSQESSSVSRKDRSWSGVLRAASPSRVMRRSSSSSSAARSTAQPAASAAETTTARSGRAESRRSNASGSSSRGSRARSASPMRRRLPFSGPVGVILSLIKASATARAPPPTQNAEDGDEPMSPTGQVTCSLSTFASRLPPLKTSFRHGSQEFSQSRASHENLASLGSSYSATYSFSPPSTTTLSCVPALFSPLSTSRGARFGGASPSPSASPSGSRSPSPLPLSPLSKTTPDLRAFPGACDVSRSTTTSTSSGSASANVSAEINVTSGSSSSSSGSSGARSGGTRGGAVLAEEAAAGNAAAVPVRDQAERQILSNGSRSFNGPVDLPVSPLAVTPLSARSETSQFSRSEFSRCRDSSARGNAFDAGIRAHSYNTGSEIGALSHHAHTFTSGNPPPLASGPRSASMERSPERVAVNSAVSNADMYAFCPLAVASSTPGRRPPRRGTGGGSGSFSGRYARSPSPQRAAPPSEPLRLGPLISAITDGEAAAIRDAVKAVRASIKACPENKKRLIQAGGVPFLVNLVAESPDGEIVEHAVTVLYNVCREEGGRDAIVSGAECGLEALVKALRAERPAARENAAAALFCLAWGIQASANGGGKGGRGSRGPSPSRHSRNQSTSSPHTSARPPSPALKSPTAHSAQLRSSPESGGFSGVLSGAGSSPGSGEGGEGEAERGGEGAAGAAAAAGTSGVAPAAAAGTSGVAPAAAAADAEGAVPRVPTSSSSVSNASLADASAQLMREQTAEIKLRIAKAGAIPALVEIFVSGSSRGKTDAVLAVLALLSGGDHKHLMEEFLSTDGLSLLLNMVQESNEDLENRAMALVSLIACSSLGRRAIRNAKAANGNGGLEVIADVLDLTTSQKARQEAVSALLLLARHDEDARRVISREGVVPALHRVTREATGSSGDKAKELLALLRKQTGSGQLQAAA